MSHSGIESDYEYDDYEDDYRGFEIRDDESSRGPLILALAMGIIIVFGAVVWNTYKQGVRDADSGLPVIAAVDTPYKHAPADPGGTVSKDQDKRIYDQLDGSERASAGNNIASPGPVIVDAKEPAGQGDALSGGPKEIASKPDTVVLDQARKLESIRGKIDTKNTTQLVAINPTLPSAPQPRVEPEKPAVPPVQEVAQSSRFDFADGGDFLVQISALRTSDAAERAWVSAKKKSPELFAGSQKHIQRADLGAKGVFYRLRVGSFSRRTAATQFCDALKSAKHQCIVVQK